MDASLLKIHATLVARGFEFVRPPAVYRGPLLIHGTEATIEIDIVDVTFARLPTVKLLDGSKLPIKQLAHLIGGGDICYFDGGLPLDLYDPGGSILRVLAEATSALERSFGGAADAEFERELASYWGGKSVYFAIPRRAAASLFRGEMIPHTQAEDSGVVAVPKGAWADKKWPMRRGVTILNLPKNLRHTARFPLQNLGEALKYIETQRQLPSGWKGAVIAAAAAGEYFFLAAPNAIIGWLPEYPSALNMMNTRPNGFRPDFFRKSVERSLDQIGLDRMTGNEVDLAYCVQRNLAGAQSLVGKRVALVGCGTIGGYLGRMLVQGGAGCGAALTLYDTDKLSPGNLGRHLLGFDDLGKRKVEALAENLRGFHPDVMVVPRVVDATTEWAGLERADIIIDATGEANVATALNALYLRSARSGGDLALLHTFVFGNGVAAQSFLNLKDGHACYRCLKTGFDGQWRHNPLKDPSSPLREAPARCGEGGYVPFSVEAPVMAAGLAMRAVLDWSAGRAGKRLRTVVVDHSAGRERVPWASPKPLPNCPACGT